MVLILKSIFWAFFRCYRFFEKVLFIFINFFIRNFLLKISKRKFGKSFLFGYNDLCLKYFLHHPFWYYFQYLTFFHIFFNCYTENIYISPDILVYFVFLYQFSHIFHLFILKSTYFTTQIVTMLLIQFNDKKKI